MSKICNIFNQNDSSVKRWVDMAIRIEGTNKTFGVHAAGVVIAAEPLDDLVPLQRNNDGQVITQYFIICICIVTLQYINGTKYRYMKII